MKTTKLLLLFAAAGLMAAACEQAEAETEDPAVAVESVSLDESISEGVTLTEGETLDIAGLITVLPENATDKSVKYSSSAEEYATVSDAGVITAVAAGEATITVTSASNGEVSASFILTVTAAEPAGNITGITVSEEGQALTYTSEVRGATDLAQFITTTPEENTDELTYSSSDEKVATVSEEGQLTIVAAGTATITVAARSNPEVNASISVTVNQYVGDYPRFEGDENDEQAAVPYTDETWYWTMTFSDDLMSVGGRNNSLYAMLDGRPIVNRNPGQKDDENITNGSAFCAKARGTAEDHIAYFTIDMGKQQKVNYFRISNISTVTGDVLVRFKKFTEISGSNDGNSFTTIANDVDFTTVQEDAANRTTGNIAITESNYRYLRFSMKGLECYGPAGTYGGSGQIEEFYLGYEAAE